MTAFRFRQYWILVIAIIFRAPGPYLLFSRETDSAYAFGGNENENL